MDEKALHLVKNYILEHIDKTDKLHHFEELPEWKDQVMQTCK